MIENTIFGNIQCESWQDFVDEITSLFDKYGQNTQILFRGQADSKWPLVTTLERELSGGRAWSIESYAMLSVRCVSEIESFTDRSWDFQEFPEIAQKIRNNSMPNLPYIPQNLYNYWVYLRHHGFPSPLLDWSNSPFIAAFFALAYEKPNDQVSIYAYIERPEGMKIGSVGSPTIIIKGPFVSTHKRHFLQQCRYTICVKHFESLPEVGGNEAHVFVSHEEVFQNPTPNQDILVEYTLPKSMSQEAVRHFNLNNINHFNLFQTEDSLVRTLALREIERHSKEL